MAFWEELGKTITDKGKEATKKAKELTEVIQIKSQISAEKTKIQEAYAAIGKICYDDNKDTQDEKYVEAFSWVKESLEKTASMEEELSQLEGSRVCAECGCRVSKEDLYCRRCGAPMAQPKEAAEEETVQAEDSPLDEVKEELSDVADDVKDALSDAVEDAAEAAEEIKDDIES